MKVRVLVEQPEIRGENPRKHLASGKVYDLDNQVAQGLLDTGQAEPVAEKPSTRAEKRPAGKSGEKR